MEYTVVYFIFYAPRHDSRKSRRKSRHILPPHRRPPERPKPQARRLFQIVTGRIPKLKNANTSGMDESEEAERERTIADGDAAEPFEAE